MRRLMIYTDGAARGNPGESASGFIVIEDKRVLEEHVSYNGSKTNNYAEYMAIANALKWCVDNIDGHEDADVVVTSDSELVIRQLNGRYAVKSDDMKMLNSKVGDLAAKFRSVKFRNVRRTNSYIVRVDRNINMFLDKRSMAK
jgi:ribonuclease HI